ncbi:MAG: MFS transporter [Candidatus Omnitrophica bacterium]|nr:MFS transporter [Candidatus Omnitrophota bacterium]
MTDILRLIHYCLTSLALGFAVIALPASGFIFRDPTRYGISDGQYGLLFLPMVTATILVGFAYTNLSARFGRHRLFCAGFVLTGIYLTLLLAASFMNGRPTPVFWTLMTAHVFLGLGFAIIMSAVNVFAIELFPNHRTSILTAIHGMFGVGALLSPLVLTLWYRAGWWQGLILTAFVEIGAAGAAAIPAKSVPPAAEPLSGTGASSNPLTLYRALPARAKGFIAVLVLYGTLEALVSNWSTIYLTRDRGFSPTTAAVCLSLFWGFLAAGRVLATFVAMRIESRHLFRAAPFVVFAGVLMLNAVRLESAVFLPYMIIGLGCSYTFPVSVSLTTRYHEPQRELLPSFMLAGLMTGVGLGSSLIGFLSGQGLFTLEQAFAAGIAVAAGLCILFFFLTRKPIEL